MQCPSCGASNPAQARFCLSCGRLLVHGIVCAACYTLLPPNARYCFHCGTMVIAAAPSCPQCGAWIALGQEQCSACGTAVATAVPAPLSAPAQPSPPVAAVQPPVSAVQPPPDTAEDLIAWLRTGLPQILPSLQRYLPRSLYEPLERRPTEQHLQEVCNHLRDLLRTIKTYLPRPVVQSPQPAGEPAGGIYQGTFLFVDVSGFTPLSERLSRMGQAGAEQITAIINDLFNDQVRVLFGHGGTLLKFGGDAMLGLFLSDSDGDMAETALRAVQAAQAMQAAMSKFAAIDAGGQTHALRIKCGISSGPYFAAHIGTHQSMSYITTGHTVNRADQAEGHASPGDVVIAQPTLELLQNQVEVEPRDEGFYLVRAAPDTAAVVDLAIHEEILPDGLQSQLAFLVERLDRLAPYLAAELLPRIVTNPNKVEMPPDRRPVTIMFVNYVGVSDLIEDLGGSRPDLITRHLNDYFVHMAQVVETYEGTMARMDQYSVGDRLVIFFGAPRAHEDDPVRAVRTALDMQEATRGHFAALQTPSGIYRFRQRVGINTGYLFAGNVGAPNLRQEYTLMGDDTNMAARLMSRADWKEILISNRTQEHVKAYFELEDRGELKVKGKEILIRTFQVLGRREEIGRTRGLDTGESPLVGRDEELQMLRQSGQGLLLGGRGQIVSLVGDSGLGKSRMLRELKAWMLGAGNRITEEEMPSPTTDLQSPVWLEAQALSFSEQTSYWLVAQILYGTLGLKADAHADDVLFTLWERGEELMGKETAREAIPFLAHLLDLPLKDQWAQWAHELEPKVRQKQTFWAAREFFAAAARERPLVVALDDLHWADEASLSMVEDLLGVTDHVSLMFCLVLRPRRDKGCWRLRNKATSAFPHRYTEVALSPLSEDQSRQLLGVLLPGAQFTPHAQQEILDKTAGNPFYLEEVVRSLIADGAVVPDPAQAGHWQVTTRIQQITVPDSLQAAIVARIDRLTEDARHALQMAAVIGRRFQVELLRNLSETEEQVEAWLAQLERTGLVRAAEVTAEPTYAFPDALVQEVAYESLLVQQRQQFHRRIGLTLEEVLAGRLEEEGELLAYHFSRSDDQDRAIKYLELAAYKARAGFANETALRHYSELLRRMGEREEAWEKRFELLDSRQQILGLLGQQGERQADLEVMLSLARAHDDAARRSDALNSLADFYQWTGRYGEAEAAATEALEIKTELQDPAGQAAALHLLGVLSYYRGDYERARPALEQALLLHQQARDAESEIWSLMYLYMIHLMRGNYAQAVELNQHALQASESRQDWFQRGIHLTNAARISLRLGEYALALDQFQQSLEMKIRVGDRIGQGFSLFGVGLACTYLERPDDAETAFQSSLTLRRQIDDERGISYSLYGLGLVALQRGQFWQEENEPQRAMDCLQRAEDYLRQAYQAHSRLGLKAETIIDLSYLGQAHLWLGKIEEALQASDQALSLLVEQKNVEEVQQIYLNHYYVLASREDPAANEFLRQAHHAMLDQAERITDPAKRQSFLTQVKVNREISRLMASIA